MEQGIIRDFRVSPQSSSPFKTRRGHSVTLKGSLSYSVVNEPLKVQIVCLYSQAVLFFPWFLSSPHIFSEGFPLKLSHYQSQKNYHGTAAVQLIAHLRQAPKSFSHRPAKLFFLKKKILHLQVFCCSAGVDSCLSLDIHSYPQLGQLIPRVLFPL